MSPLNPPQWFRKTRGIHRIGLAIDKPLAANVLEGTLYYSADTSILERSNGISWETYSGSGGGSGSIGLTGPPGIDGINGIDGIDGIQGINGISGIQGIQGIQGIDGRNGIPGLDGKNGEEGIGSLYNFQYELNRKAAYLAPLHCILYNNATQSVASGTNTLVEFNSEDDDIGGLHDVSTNNSRITIPVGGAGIWMFTFYVLYHPYAGVATVRQVIMLRNGAQFGGLTSSLSDASGSFFTPITFAVLFLCADGDYFELQAYQGSAVSQNIGHATRAYSNTFAATRLVA